MNLCIKFMGWGMVLCLTACYAHQGTETDADGGYYEKHHAKDTQIKDHRRYDSAPYRQDGRH